VTMPAPEPLLLRQGVDACRAVLDHAPIAIVAVDLSGAVTAWNPAAERLFGWTSAEVLGRPNPTLRPEDWPAFEQVLERAARGELDADVEGPRLSRDGGVVVVTGSRGALRGSSGAPIGVVDMVTDAAAWAGAVVALSESEERYRSVVASLEEGITVHDEAGRILDANPSAERILGMPVEELAGRTFMDPEWAAVDLQQRPLPVEEEPVAATLATGRPCLGAVLGIHAMGGLFAPERELRWLQLNTQPVSRAGAAKLVCSFRDITFDRHEEELRQRTDANFRALIERTPDAVSVYRDDALVYVNPRTLELLGYEHADELLGQSPMAFVHPEDRAMVLDRMRAYGPSRESPAAEERFLRRDGSAVWTEVTTMPIFFDGAPSTLVHARDMTYRKRLEAQVVMADRLASVGRLAAAVGHEVNNPLAFAMANLDLALERLADLGAPAEERLADVAEMLREAREGADRVRHIVRDLRVFSRGETGEKALVDPRRVFDSCVNMARGEIRMRARLTKRYDETPPVLANEARLGQVLLNLLVNAAHAIPEGDPDHNEILVATRADAQGRVVIEVRDTGVGMPEEVKRHVFEPFFTTKTGGRGTGLGLSICQTIVSSLGGEIAFESEIGRGTSFRVILPPAPAGHAAGPPRRG
jgi:two-component system NtrC family sensor kinase